MNAQDDDVTSPIGEAEVLATVDRVLAEPDSVTPNDPRTLEAYCAQLARAVPQADPAFQAELGRRLAVEVERRKGQPSGLTRMRSFVAWRPHLHIHPRAARLRIVSLMLALVVAIGSVGAYLHVQTPTPVDARTLLHRVAAASPGPNEAVHETYRLSAGGGITGTTEVWIAADADGLPSKIALTQNVRENGSPDSAMSGRLVQTPQLLQVYDPASNTVTQSSARGPVQISANSTSMQNLEGILVGTMVAQKLSRALASGMHPNAFKLEQQTLDDVSVYALKLDETGGQTFYFNTQSYVLEGADWTEGGRSWQARLDSASYTTMQVSAAPSGTFTLNAPASARVVVLSSPAEGPKSSGSDPIITTMATACHTTPQAVTSAMQAGASSLLAVCRETDPSMTADGLVTALIAQFKVQLDAQVASGSITASEEATDLANLRLKLTAMVNGKTGSGPQGPPGKKP